MRIASWQQIMLTFLLVVFGAGLAAAAEEPATAKEAEPKSEKAARKGPGRGDTPPVGLGLTRGGDSIETTQFAGKVLVVTFWASWCGPCRAELPILENLQKAAKGNVQVVAVNIEERDKFRALARILSSLTLTLTNDQYKRHSAEYGVNGIPHMVIIGKDGKILNVHRGYSESMIDGLVAEINAALAKG